MKNLNKLYTSSEILSYYSSSRNRWFDFYKSEREVIKKLNFNKNSTVLDIGSACGGLGKVLKKKYGIKNYTGIEINRKAYDFAKKNLKEFKFINTDLLNYQNKIKVRSKFDFVFSLGCVDWNVELQKMLVKSWKHVKVNGYLIITLRLTLKKSPKKSFQFINFSKKKKGEKASYQVLSFSELKGKLSSFNISNFFYHGYWGRPNKTVVTKYRKIYFIALALKKDKKKFNIFKKENIKNLIQT